MKKVLSALTLMVLCVLVISGSVLAEGKVTVMGVWGGQEVEAFNKMVKPFEERTGIDVQFEGTRDLPTLLVTRLEAGNPPDVVAIQGIGMMKDYASQGHLVDLKNVLDMGKFKEQYDQKWIDLGTYKDGLYGIYISADVKSFVWYNPRVWEEKGYEVPATWDELETLTLKMIANGDIPWSIGLESGAASGWPGTDWIEDIMLRTAGPEVYDKWVAHDIPWTDDRVKRAFEIFGKIARNPKFVWGGPVTVLSTNFGDAANPLFMDPPQAMMHRQASFIVSFIKDNNPDVVAGEDFDFFAFPEINEEYGTPVLGAADMISMMNDTPEARKFIKYLASAEAQSIWVSELGKLGVNNNIELSVYPDELTRKMAKVLLNASTFRFDGSDSMPAAIGAGAFWQGVLDYVNGQDLDAVLERIEEAADETYTTGAATN